MPKYNKLIYTNHAAERMMVRRISKKMIEQTVQSPNDSELEDDGDTQFKKTVNGRNVHVIAKPLPDEKAWLIKTVWVRGEDDPNPIIKFALTMLVKLFPQWFK